jgi:hypothetical protein
MQPICSTASQTAGSASVLPAPPVLHQFGDPSTRTAWRFSKLKVALQGRSTPEAVRDALAGGAGAVQLRLKDGDGGACLRQVRARTLFRP